MPGDILTAILIVVVAFIVGLCLKCVKKIIVAGICLAVAYYLLTTFGVISPLF